MKTQKIKLYPRTNRFGSIEEYWEVTEKLDGSNIGFFKRDGELYVAQRNLVYKAIDAKECSTYPALVDWLVESNLQELLHDNAIVFGEWLGMGQIGYGKLDNTKRFYMFCKGNIDENLIITNITYRRDLLHWSYLDGEFPPLVNLVPLVYRKGSKPNIDKLDELYETYLSEVDRAVEGFVVTDGNTFEKYIRNVGKGVQPHDPKGYKQKEVELDEN